MANETLFPYPPPPTFSVPNALSLPDVPLVVEEPAPAPPAPTDTVMEPDIGTFNAEKNPPAPPAPPV